MTVSVIRAAVEVSGTDSEPFLNRILSNSLSRDQDCYALLLSPEGRLVAGGYWQYVDNQGWLCYCHPNLAESLSSGLHKYIFFRDQVRVAERGLVTLKLDDHPKGCFFDLGRPMQIIGTCPGSPSGTIDPNPEERIRSGFPLLGVDFIAGDIPLVWDYGFTLAHKGCYPGQEVIERMWSRGRRGRGRALICAADTEVLLAEAQRCNWELRPSAISANGSCVALALVPEIQSENPAHSESCTISVPFIAVPASLSMPFSAWLVSSS